MRTKKKVDFKFWPFWTQTIKIVFVLVERKTVGQVSIHESTYTTTVQWVETKREVNATKGNFYLETYIEKPGKYFYNCRTVCWIV